VLKAVKSHLKFPVLGEHPASELQIEVVFVLLSAEAVDDLTPLEGRSPSHVFLGPADESLLPERETLLEFVANLERPPKAKAPFASRASDADDFGTGISGGELDQRVSKLDQQLTQMASQMTVLMTKFAPESSLPTQTPVIHVAPPSPTEQIEKLGLTPEQTKIVKGLIGQQARILPERQRPHTRSVLSESEEDDPPSEKDDSPPVEKAIVMMSKLLKKQGSKAKNPLKAVYDGLTPSLGFGSEPSPSMPASRGAQGYHALRSLVKSHPALVVSMIEKNMRTRNVGSAESFTVDSSPNTKFYVEHRSLITGHVANATWAWTLASIVDLLNENPPKIEEARARALLAVAAAEQVSLDQGSWLYAADLLMLESDPPFSSLDSHNPGLSRTAHSQLVDPQWYETVAARIKSLEDSQERKVKHLRSATGNENRVRRPGPPAKAKAGGPPPAGPG